MDMWAPHTAELCCWHTATSNAVPAQGALLSWQPSWRIETLCISSPLSIFLLKPDQMNTKTTSAGWSCTAVWYQHHCFWNRLPKISYSSTASWLLSPTGWLQACSNKWKTSHKQRELAQFFGQLLHLKATPAIPVQGENGLCCNAREVSGFWRERISVQQCSQTMLDML